MALNAITWKIRPSPSSNFVNRAPLSASPSRSLKFLFPTLWAALV